MTVYRFTDAARAARHAIYDRWFVDDACVKVAGRSTDLYRAIDQRGQVIDVLLCERPDAVLHGRSSPVR